MQNKFKSEFQEIGSLGCGGFSTVFEAKSFKDDKLYAIKKIPLTDEEKDKTMKEIEIICSLNSDHVVEYTDSWLEDNYYIGSFDASSRQNISSSNLLYDPNKPLLLHIQMELCTMTLELFIQQMKKENVRKLTKEKYSSICDIFKQLLECVHYLHQFMPPIIHRDLKPENIMLTMNEGHYKVKVTDFGLSTYHEFVDQSHTKYTGTVSYRAPEVETKRYDTKADIYSLGKIMQILFNIDLVKETTKIDIEIESKHRNANMICIKCLLVEPKERPDCQQILNEYRMWNYTIEQITCVQNNDFNFSLLFLMKILFEKWPLLTKIERKLLFSCKKIAIIEDLEEKAIFTTSDRKLLALRVSDHIDSTLQEPTIIDELEDHEIQNIVCGYEHVLCVTKDMRVYSFGNNHYGQLGNRTKFNNNKPKVIGDLNDKKIVDLKCGAYHSLALSESGKLYAWGAGWFGQVGLCLDISLPIPIEMFDLKTEKIVSISCGFHHCLALSESGSLYGWGYNAFGQLGSGNTSNQHKPVLIKFDDGIIIKKITCGHSHNLVLTSNNDIISFGNNTCGQLGLGNTNKQNGPTMIKTELKFVDFNTSFYTNLSIGLDLNNKYYIWGKCNDESIYSPKLTNFKSFNEILIYSSPNYQYFRSLVNDNLFSEDEINEWNIFKYFNQKSIPGIKSLCVARIKETKAILVTNNDTIYSFRLSESVDSPVEEPVVVKELTNKKLKSIICGDDYVLCLTYDHEVFSFGDNRRGQLGNGTTTANYTPQKIRELNNKHIIDISCGQYHCLALSDYGKIFVWGYGHHGQIGNGLDYDRLSPLELKSINTKNIVSFSCGSLHCLALASNGELFGWGDNKYGQVGVGSTKSQKLPILILNQQNLFISKISCGQYHNLILTNDKSIYSFGRNNCGQLGIGNTDDQNIMTRIETNIKFVDISTSWDENISAALSNTGKYYIWGECDDDVITSPKETDFSSFDEILIKYSKAILPKHLNLCQ